MIKYVGAQGEVYDLRTETVRITKGDFHSFKWKSNIKKTNYGHTVDFEKEQTIYTISINFRGNEIRKIEEMNGFIDILERDVENVTPATLWINGMHTKGFAISCKSGPSEDNETWSRIEFEFWSENSVWIGEELFRYTKTSVKSTNNRRYPYKYANRYANGLNLSRVINRYKKDANFLLRVYGPAKNPMVVIGERKYQVNVTLEVGELIEVNTVTRAVEKVSAKGIRENAFHYRAKRESVFNKIKPGTQNVSWSGLFDFDLIVYDERREPRW